MKNTLAKKQKLTTGALIDATNRLFAKNYSISLILILLLALIGILSKAAVDSALPLGTSASDYTTVTELIEAMKVEGTLNTYILAVLGNAIATLVMYFISLAAYVRTINTGETATLYEAVTIVQRRLLPIVLMSVIVTMLTFLGLVLLILPGLLISIWCMYVPLILVDRPFEGIVATIKKSRKLYRYNMQLPLVFVSITIGLLLVLLFTTAPIVLTLGADHVISIALQQTLSAAMIVYFSAGFSYMYTAAVGGVSEN